MVHVAGSEAVAEQLRRWAGEPRLIVWHDALHEGPVPPGLPLEALTAARGAHKKLKERDRQLRRLVARDSLWLWFGDNLGDQLQLLQALDFLHSEGLTASPHFIVDIPRELTVDRMAALAASKTRVTPDMFDTARRAWHAFTNNEVPALLATNLSALPHLRPAIERLLQHGPENNRVQQTILALLKEGGKTASQLFAEYRETEERPFLGETDFLRYLDALAPQVQKDLQGIYRPGFPSVP